MKQSAEEDVLRDDDSWPKLIFMLTWALFKQLGMWAGIMAVVWSALFCSFSIIYGKDHPFSKLPDQRPPDQLFLIGLLIQACCTYASKSWLKRLLTLRDLLIYSLGIIHSFFLAVFVLIIVSFGFVARRNPPEMEEIAALFGAAVLYYASYKFLKARHFLILPRWKYSPIVGLKTQESSRSLPTCPPPKNI